MSQKTSLAAQSPHHLVNYHPQPPASIGHHVQGGFKFIGNVLSIAAIAIFVNNVGVIGEYTNSLWSSWKPDAATVSSLDFFASDPADVFSEEYELTSRFSPEAGNQQLYLMDKASLFVTDEQAFEEKVRDISGMLGIAPEWLMAVMYSESKFDASVENYKGSGATGLIQFMETTAGEMRVSLERLARMNHLQQLEYVYLYLQTVRDRYGDYEGLTDLYLAVLYPKARKQEYCYTLYARPSQQYNQNSGLDENKDGRVTVSDISRRMKRLYPMAFIAEPAIS